MPDKNVVDDSAKIQITFSDIFYSLLSAVSGCVLVGVLYQVITVALLANAEHVLSN